MIFLKMHWAICHPKSKFFKKDHISYILTKGKVVEDWSVCNIDIKELIDLNSDFKSSKCNFNIWLLSLNDMLQSLLTPGTLTIKWLDAAIYWVKDILWSFYNLTWETDLEQKIDLDGVLPLVTVKNIEEYQHK